MTEYVRRIERISDKIESDEFESGSVEIIYRYLQYNDDESKRYGRGWYDVINKDNYTLYITRDLHQARAIAIIISAYRFKPPTKKDGKVPYSIAQAGSAETAVYLYGGVMFGAENVCKIIDITEETLKKYVRRVEKRLSK